jgi:hypothetical protein
MTENEKKFNELLLNFIKKWEKKMDEFTNEETKEIPREFDLDGTLMKHVVILNPSKEKEAWRRFFDSFPQWIGRENHQ